MSLSIRKRVAKRLALTGLAVPRPELRLTSKLNRIRAHHTLETITASVPCVAVSVKLVELVSCCLVVTVDTSESPVNNFLLPFVALLATVQRCIMLAVRRVRTGRLLRLTYKRPAYSPVPWSCVALLTSQ